MTKETESLPIIRIVLDNGTVYRYPVKTMVDVREHLQKIMTTGFRSDSPDGFRCFPVHRISHIDAILPEGMKDELMKKYPASSV